MIGIWFGRVACLVAILALVCPITALAEQHESGPTGVPCRAPLPALRNGTFNVGDGPVRLTNGSACVKASPDQQGCEWRIGLTRAETWGAGGQFLLVVINRNHQAGGGAFDAVFWYACEEGTFVPVWSHTYRYGATIEKRPDTDLWITSGVWRPTDPSCCPSQERREHLSWNGATRSVVLRGSSVTARRQEN